MINVTNYLEVLNWAGVQSIGILTKYLSRLFKSFIGYSTALISANLEPGRIANVVALEDVASVQFYRFVNKTIHILFEYFIQKPHNCEVFFEPVVFKLTKWL